MEEIPVIILNWNGFDDTVECVDSVLAQSFQQFKIYLADNCSDNQEFERLVEKYSDNPKIVFIKNGTNLGFTLAHNQLFELLKNSNADYVALINNDAVADTYWLENAIGTAKEMGADIVTCKMISYNDRSIIDSAGLFLLSSGEILPAQHGENVNSTPMKTKPIAASGGACLYKLSMLEEIGTFDPYFSTGYEDAELGLRAFLAGYTIEYDPASIVYHKMSRSVSKIVDQKKVQKIQEDINYTYLKLMPAFVIAINALPNLTRIAIILLIHLITFRLRFINGYLKAFKTTLTKDWFLIISNRKELGKIRRRSSFEILKTQQFWMVYDLFRFFRHIIKGERNKFEKY